jgi:O-antigen/teichoic acid export membrane protein
VLGGFLGAAIAFTATVVAGRALGPAEYGRVSLVLVLSQAFALLGAVGLDVASARTVPRAAPAAQRAYVSTATSAVLVTLGIAAVLVAALSPVVADLAGTTRELVLLAVAAGVVLGLRTLLERQVAGLERFRPQSLGRIAEAVAILALVLVVLFVLDGRTYRPVVVALNLGALVVVGIYAWTLRSHLSRAAVSRESLADLARYARIAVLHAVTPIGFVYGDRLVVHDQLGAAQLGIYTAYYTASYVVVSQLLGVTTNVLFPAAARLDDKAPIIAKLRRLRLLGTPLVVLGLMAVTWVVLLLFGERFPYSPLTAALFGLWGALLLFNGLFTVLTVTHSERTYLLTALLQGVRSVVFVAYLVGLVAVDAVSVRTVLAGMIAIEVLEAANLRTIIARHVLRPAG